MFKTFKEILRVGNATVSYPFAPLERPEYVRGKPEHDLELCVACAACANACPPNAIQMDIDLAAGTISWSINYGRCIFCGRCEEVCPTRAIVLTEEFELAVFDRSDLEHVCTYPLQKCTECATYYAPAKEISYVKAILMQDRLEEDVSWALDLLEICPECKQNIDAMRARDAVDAAGNPTPEPSAEAMAESQRIARQRKEGAYDDFR